VEIRVDRIQFPVVKKTEEGYLKGEAIVSRSGVFKYRNLDGTERLELRHPDDIFTIDSLDTLKAIPITNDHPAVLVNSENIGSLAVGLTGETVKVDDEALIASINITHKDGIEAINRGKKELSLGYTLDVIEEIGTYNGEKYTHRQTNVKYNHLALVEKARAGRSARINIDGALISEEIIGQEKKMEEVQKLNKCDDHEKTKKEETIMQERLDKAYATIDQLRQEVADLKAIRVDSLIAEQAKKRIALLNKVSKFINTDDALDKTDRQIMELVIKAKIPDLRLDDKADAYIEGRFDTILELADEKPAIQRQLASVANNSDAYKELKPVLEVLKNHYKQKAN